jgi:hypothetical protein
LEVADYDRNRPAVSSVILCKRFRKQDSQPRGGMIPSKYAPLVSDGIEFTPAGDTHFRTGDAMAAYFEIYEPGLTATNQTTKVQFRMRITRVDTDEVKIDSGLRDATPFVSAGSPVVAISQQIALDKLSPGAYRLEVQGPDSAGNHTDWRATSFTIE